MPPHRYRTGLYSMTKHHNTDTPSNPRRVEAAEEITEDPDSSITDRRCIPNKVLTFDP